MACKVFVSGCYDMLHSGHVAFFEEAARLGDLYVGIGSDKTIIELKARKPVNTEAERLFMVKALKAVKDAWINSGSGLLDFAEDLRKFRPDIFFVNEDGHTPAKETLCRELGINYVVGKRRPYQGLPRRSTTALRQECDIPYRIDLAGGWLDQPFVSQLSEGAVITVCIEPDLEFNDRSGMATSTRKKAVELWHTGIPEGNREQLARTLFCMENPPGNRYVSGSQDAIGIVYPGLNRLTYQGDFWPDLIESVTDPSILDWVEKHIRLIQLQPRERNYDVLGRTELTAEGARDLAEAADLCWKAVLEQDLRKFGEGVRHSFEAQRNLFPLMVSKEMEPVVKRMESRAEGIKVCGAGGGGYLLLVTDKEIENAFKIRIRRD